MAAFRFGDCLVCGKCDSDLYYLWLLYHTLDDSFGSEHLMRRIPQFSSAWLSLLRAVDDMFEGSFDDDGDSGEFITLMIK